VLAHGPLRSGVTCGRDGGERGGVSAYVAYIEQQGRCTVHIYKEWKCCILLNCNAVVSRVNCITRWFYSVDLDVNNSVNCHLDLF
jgi:hypothetical protein